MLAGDAAPHLRSIRDAVSHLTAIQAQDLPAALWAIGVRTQDSATVSDVRESFNRAEIVRGWPMRGTLHAVAAIDLGWMLDISTERLVRGAATRQKQLGLSEETLTASRRVAEKLLEGGGRATRSEFLQRLNSDGISTDGQRGYHIIWYLSQTGTICWGPFRGAEQELILTDEWIKHPRSMDQDEALCEFATRYITGHGPVTFDDFISWTGMTKTQARRGIAEAAATGQIEQRIFNSEPMLIPTESVVDPPASAHDYTVLTGFDEYYLGYRSRDAVVAPEYFQQIVPGNNGIFKPVLLRQGEVIATWRKKTSTSKKNPGMRIELIPLRSEDKGLLITDDAYLSGFENFAAFWETPLISVQLAES